MGLDSFPLVDTRDVGAAAAIVLGNPVAHAGQAYALTGPPPAAPQSRRRALQETPASSFDYLIGAGEERGRDREAHGASGFQVQD
jgi:uncharacterized protein YbjT (DUF2867 family)